MERENDSCRWYARCTVATCPCQRDELPATVAVALAHWQRLQRAFEAAGQEPAESKPQQMTLFASV